MTAGRRLAPHFGGGLLMLGFESLVSRALLRPLWTSLGRVYREQHWRSVLVRESAGFRARR